jgi:hypothetical protein
MRYLVFHFNCHVHLLVLVLAMPCQKLYNMPIICEVVFGFIKVNLNGCIHIITKDNNMDNFLGKGNMSGKILALLSSCHLKC